MVLVKDLGVVQEEDLEQVVDLEVVLGKELEEVLVVALVGE